MCLLWAGKGPNDIRLGLLNAVKLHHRVSPHACGDVEVSWGELPTVCEVHMQVDGLESGIAGESHLQARRRETVYIPTCNPRLAVSKETV